MTRLQFTNATREHAMGVVCVVLGIAMVAVGNLVSSLSFMADGGNVVATLGFISSLAKSVVKSGDQTADKLDEKIDKRLAGQTEELIGRLTNTGLENTSSVRALEKDRDSHAARLDAHDAKHAAHDATAADHGEVLDNHGEHIRVMSHALIDVAKKVGENYQPIGVLKARRSA